jgi:hypothetical protein
MQETLVTPLVSRERKERSWEHFTLSISLHFTRFMPLSMATYSPFHASISDSSMRIIAIL